MDNINVLKPTLRLLIPASEIVLMSVVLVRTYIHTNVYISKENPNEEPETIRVSFIYK